MIKRRTRLVFSCLIVAAISAMSSAQIVTNGNFANFDTSGWTLTNNDGSNYVSLPSGDDIKDANAFAIGQFLNDGPMSISQDLTLQAGKMYTLSFEADAEAYTSGGINLFQVDLGNSIVAWKPTFPGDQMPTVFSETFTATSTSEKLSFSGYNQNSRYEFTDVSVSANAIRSVPAPPSCVVFGFGAFGLILRKRKK